MKKTKGTVGLIPPQSPEAEQQVLGAILRDQGAIDVATTVLQPNHFYYPKHRLIYSKFLELHGKSEPCDIVVVCDALIASGQLEEAGGRVYLVNLADSVASTSNIEHYCGIVLEKWKLRKIDQVAIEIRRSAQNQEMNSDDLIDALEAALLPLTATKRGSAVTLKTLLEEYSRDVKSGRSSLRKQDIIETRVPDLDRRLGGGFFKGDLIVVAGPPSMGKTAFALDTCVYNTFILKKRALYFSLDQSNTSILYRVLTGKTGLTKDLLRERNFLENEQIRVVKSIEDSLPGSENLLLIDRGGLTAHQVRSISRRSCSKSPIDLIVLDYLTQLRSSITRSERRDLEIADDLGILKQVAKELNVVVMVLSQLNRQYDQLPIKPDKGEWGIPTQAMLRDSGAIEQEANVILFPWRPLEALAKRGKQKTAEYRKLKALNPDPIEDAFIAISKSKDTETGLVECKFNRVRMQFYSGSHHSDADVSPNRRLPSG